MKEKIRFGLVGCGRIAPRHAQSLMQIENAELVAVSDIKPSRAERYSEEYCVDCYDDYRYLLDRKDIDVINICTPSGLHSIMAIHTLQAGKNVICEKPMALNLDDADLMINTAAHYGKKLCIVLQNRFNPPMRDMHQAIAEGKIGRIFLGATTVRWFRPQSYYEDDWHGTLAMDGGALMNQTIHHIDALQWMMGMPNSVYAYTATLAHKMEAEDVGVAVLKFPGGALATIEGSTVTFPENMEASVAVFGETGSLKVGGTALNRKVIWKIDGELENEKLILSQEDTDSPRIYGISHKAVIEDMISAVTNDQEPKTNGPEGRKSVSIVLAMYESSKTGKQVDFAGGNFG
jgi:UDP-N-acetyl-2-amino-2-deoxyglucuronate dehydrogenase